MRLKRKKEKITFYIAAIIISIIALYFALTLSYFLKRKIMPTEDVSGRSYQSKGNDNSKIPGHDRDREDSVILVQEKLIKDLQDQVNGLKKNLVEEENKSLNRKKEVVSNESSSNTKSENVKGKKQSNELSTISETQPTNQDKLINNARIYTSNHGYDYKKDLYFYHNLIEIRKRSSDTSKRYAETTDILHGINQVYVDYLSNELDSDPNIWPKAIAALQRQFLTPEQNKMLSDLINKSVPQYHIVSGKENLRAISKEYNIPYDRLLELNHQISSTNALLKKGDTVLLK
jgi:hypothetical protein